MAEEIDLEKCNFRNFRDPMTLTLTLDRVRGHRASVIDLYIHTKFHWHRKKICGL